MRRSLFLALLLAAAPVAAAPAERPILSLNKAELRALPLAIAAPIYPAASGSRAAGQAIDETLHQDLGVSGLFELLDRKSFLAEASEGVAPVNIKFQRWQDVGAEGLIKVVVSGADPITAEFHLYNAVTGKEELTRRLSGPAAEARRLGHAFADEVFTFYTREQSVFQTRIAFVRPVKGLKQIFVAEWDGQRAVQLTRESLNLLPAWMPDGERVAYTGYKLGNPNLFVHDLRKGSTDVLFKRFSRLITGVSPSRDGRKIAFAMSEEDGNSHLWVSDVNGNHPRRLTEGFGINSSPSFSPDGKQIAFVSNRGGNPQIYLISADGGAPRRLTFQGNYNQTPDWSPRGDLIAFTARDERNVFDIFTVDPTTSKITRLTQDQGNNEEPSFSPNGRLIAFTSTRSGRSHLYVMSADGNFQKQLTSGDQTAFTPTWGPLMEAKR